jgi:eukaryotic-like serine/threonine-protein kinase
MNGRAPSGPPDLPGFEHIEKIGAGGYATVYLYRQFMPSRKVAIKVLAAANAGDTAFASEANVMAQVSAHPYIVSIYEVGVAGDGRPFLAMEYYPGSNYLERCRDEHFSVADAVRVGIQISGALATAHRVGILHHDVKPANILTSEYGRPGLTDFGIASADSSGQTQAVSIPWSPPEAFGSGALDVRSDVYSLAATVYHLLAGRSPYALPNGPNSEFDLMNRIERDRLPAIGRADVPASLERALAQALAKRPDQRPADIIEFARSLQSVENELRLAATPLELPDVGGSRPAGRSEPDDDATRVRGVVQVDPRRPTAPDTAGSRRDEPEAPDATVLRRGAARSDEPAQRDQRPAPAADTTTSPRSPRWWIAAAGGAAAAVAAVVLFTVVGGSDGGTSSPTTTLFSLTNLDDADLLLPVDDLTGAASDGGVTFTWTAPAAGPLEYLYTLTTEGSSVTAATTATQISAPAEPGTEVCIRIVSTKQGSSDSASRATCATA